jgi:hypothetical protein
VNNVPKETIIERNYRGGVHFPHGGIFGALSLYTRITKFCETLPHDATVKSNKTPKVYNAHLTGAFHRRKLPVNGRLTSIIFQLHIRKENELLWERGIISCNSRGAFYYIK